MYVFQNNEDSKEPTKTWEEVINIFLKKILNIKSFNENCDFILIKGEPVLCHFLVIGALKPFLNRN